MKPFSEMHTPGGYLCGEVTSAMQKALRRGKEREAIFWATELDLAGYGNYVWKRLRMIASEDVGVGDPLVAVQVRCLYENWKDFRRDYKDDAQGPDRLFLIHAVVVIARAKKSRIVDHALLLMYEGDRTKVRFDVPDYALDKHTRRGRSKGRGVEHFFDVASQLRNRARIVDPYVDEARAALVKKKR